MVNLHWLGHGLISLRQMRKITKPIVWTLHDEWSIHAISHYPETNFNKRKSQHKTNCKNELKLIKLDLTIRENGGWETK